MMLEKLRENKTLRFVSLILFALYLIVHVVLDVLSLHQVPDALSDYIIWRHQTFSNELTIAVGLALVISGMALVGHELRRDPKRNWLARPAAVCATVGVVLLVSLGFYKTVPTKLLELTAGVGEAHALTNPAKANEGVTAGQGATKYAANLSSDEGEPSLGESATGTASTQAFKSEIPSKGVCGCSHVSEVPSTGAGEASRESVREFEPEEEEFEPEEEEFESEFEEEEEFGW